MGHYSPSLPPRESTDHNQVEELNFPSTLRQLLAGYLAESVSVHDCAELVGMSCRSLQRRLSLCGTSYNELIDQVRFDAAKQLLNCDDLSVSDISAELGYGDSANFTRAFRRWAGVSPRQHRKLAKSID